MLRRGQLVLILSFMLVAVTVQGEAQAKHRLIFGGSDAVDPLIDCLLDTNKTVQGAAAAALVDIARSTTVEGLASALASRAQDVKDRAISCVRLLDREVADGVTSCWDREIARPKTETGPDRQSGDGEVS